MSELTAETTKQKRVLNIGKIDPNLIRAQYVTAKQKAEEISRQTEQGRMYTDLLNQLFSALEKDKESFRTLVFLAGQVVENIGDLKSFEGSLASWLNKSTEAKKHFRTFKAAIDNEYAEGKYLWVAKIEEEI